jgi:hypothetical protein
VSVPGSGLEKFAYAGSVDAVAGERRELGDHTRDAIQRAVTDAGDWISAKDIEGTGLAWKRRVISAQLQALAGQGLLERDTAAKAGTETRRGSQSHAHFNDHLATSHDGLLRGQRCRCHANKHFVWKRTVRPGTSISYSISAAVIGASHPSHDCPLPGPAQALLEASSGNGKRPSATFARTLW